MILRSSTPNSKRLAPMRPSAGVAAWYERELLILINAMCYKVSTVLIPIYRSAPEPVLPLTFPKGELDHALERLEVEWNKVFDSKADELAFGMTFRVLRHHDHTLSESIRSLGIHPPVPKPGDDVYIAMDDAKSSFPKWKDYSIKFDFTPQIKNVVKKHLRENIDLISSKNIKDGPAIPKKFFGEIRKMAYDSIEKGRDVMGFTDALEDRFGITRRRASLIARDQNNKMTATFHQSRQVDLGIKKAAWIETYASIHPREETHAAFANGENGGPEYDVDEGVDFDDGMGPVVPGQAINCGCISQSIIPGYDD